jgi:DNA-binding NarL/FixJ family response regulator
MPDMNGIEATRKLAAAQPGVKVIGLSGNPDTHLVSEMLKAGASAYVIKQAAPAELVLAIQSAHAGGRFLSPLVSGKIIDGYLQQAADKGESDPYDKLTDREREVLQLIADGHGSRDIATMLQISVKTAEAHRAHLMEKLGLRSTALLVRYAMRKGLSAPDE